MEGDSDAPIVDAAGRIVLPDRATAHLECIDGDDLVYEAVPNGVVVTVDRLRKVYVEATGQCNLRCTMCPRQAWAPDSGHMTDACFDRLLIGLPAVPPGQVTLAFGGFGEPTLHPRFLDMVEQTRRAGRRVEVITNGTTMTADLAQALASLGVAQVTVSVDGGDDEAFEAMRGTSRGPILEGLVLLREHARRGHGRMSIGVACVATKQTVGSLAELIAAAKRLRLDFVSIMCYGVDDLSTTPHPRRRLCPKKAFPSRYGEKRVLPRSRAANRSLPGGVSKCPPALRW
jgi:molybdenum cofactor biosynthesis enzyme MoaA